MRKVAIRGLSCAALTFFGVVMAGCGGGGGSGSSPAPAASAGSAPSSAAPSAAPATAFAPLPANLSGPSTATVAEAATFQGGGLSANSTLSITVIAPDGSETRHAVITGPDGGFTHTLTPTVPGKHRVEVLDGTGQAVVSLELYAARN